MGQKVNPVGLRLGINRGWDSVWYAKKKDFGNYLIEDYKIRDFIKKNVWLAYLGLFVILIIAIQLIIGGLVNYEVLSINEKYEFLFAI